MATATLDWSRCPVVESIPGTVSSPNPFVVGAANYGKFLDVMAECMQADIARRVK